jgi:hypothetical protein
MFINNHYHHTHLYGKQYYPFNYHEMSSLCVNNAVHMLEINKVSGASGTALNNRITKTQVML